MKKKLFFQFLCLIMSGKFLLLACSPVSNSNQNQSKPIVADHKQDFSIQSALGKFGFCYQAEVTADNSAETVVHIPDPQSFDVNPHPHGDLCYAVWGDAEGV